MPGKALMSETSKHRRRGTSRSQKGTRSQQISVIQANLKEFRKRLNLSQEAFGKVFGEYTRRQIHSYETGESEIPLALLLAIRDKGYPVEVILGPPEQATLVTEIVRYLGRDMKVYASLKRLMKDALKSLEQEEQTLANLLQRVNALTGLIVPLPVASSSRKVGSADR
jgi:transcriptional regulator with XRE-family HTH domain